MMTTLSVTIDDKVAETAPKYAAECDTTVDALVEGYPVSLPNPKSTKRAQASAKLIKTIEQLSRPMGGKPWNHRDELHDR
jgi:hypothetical protein